MSKQIFRTIIALSLCCFIYGCGHEHTWKDATCTEPKTCTECGETEGEPLGHTWIDATCTSPKTCEICGQTEGEPNGHVTDMGVCSACGEFVNSDAFMDLCQKLGDVPTPNSGNIKGDTIDAMYPGCITVYEESLKTVEEYQKILDEYSSYKGASDFIAAIKDVIDAKPSKPSKTRDSMLDFFDEMENFMLKHQKLIQLKADKLNAILEGGS